MNTQVNTTEIRNISDEITEATSNAWEALKITSRDTLVATAKAVELGAVVASTSVKLVITAEDLMIAGSKTVDSTIESWLEELANDDVVDTDTK
jgi:hypothetical protein